MNGALFIPTGVLKHISNENYNKLNRSIDVDVLLDNHPDMIGVLSPFHITHDHAFGKPVETHYRLVINEVMLAGGETINLTLTQDITAEQMEQIQNLKQEIMDYQEESKTNHPYNLN